MLRLCSTEDTENTGQWPRPEFTQESKIPTGSNTNWVTAERNAKGERRGPPHLTGSLRLLSLFSANHAHHLVGCVSRTGLLCLARRRWDAETHSARPWKPEGRLWTLAVPFLSSVKSWPRPERTLCQVTGVDPPGRTQSPENGTNEVLDHPRRPRSRCRKLGWHHAQIPVHCPSARLCVCPG
jgi:hypothetical protein